jgi:hypothetical protein
MALEQVKENEDYSDFDDDSCICEGCGRDVNSYDSVPPCPLCCGSDFSPGNEECDLCGYYNECAKE